MPLIRFRDRYEAGRLLAAKLAAYADRNDVIVLALPRGGVPVRTKRLKNATRGSTSLSFASSVSRIKASASEISGHTNRAAVAEKSVGEATFDLTGAPAASKHPRRRSSELRQ
jgi:hypothetical protein